jgi:predicted dehydrogenase
MKSYKICFVGAAGHWGYVTDDMAHLTNTEFAGYAPSFPNEDLSALANLQIRGQKAKFYTDYLEMFDREKPDLVSITPRYDLIAPIAMEAAQRGIHVIAEKPLALDLLTLAKLRATVEKSGIQLTAMFGIRFEAAFFTAKKLIENGAIGEPILIWAQKSYRWGTNRPEWYKHRATYGSTINWVGIHALDWARWLSGLEFAEVFGYHSTLVHQDFPDCQDNCGLVAKLSNGGTAVFNFDYLRPATAPTHGDDRIKITGSEGVLEVIGREKRLDLIDAQGEHLNWPLLTPPTFLADFLGALEGKHPALISMADACRVTEIALKATQAADTGQIVKL